MYPDVVVNCSPRGSRGRTSIDDPVLVIEVASPSTEKYDATEKRWAYQSIPSLRHLVFLAQDKALAEIASRNADGTWTSRFIEGLDAIVELPALELGLPMRELYEDVEPEPSTAQKV
jgi:Uma2 family endonuclease